MSETTPTSGSAPTAFPAPPGVQVRLADHRDVQGVVGAVRELLSELGATPSGAPAMEQAVRLLLDTPAVGAVFVAEVDGELVGVLAASWQVAIHVPGSYALIQDLWVHPAWRSRMIGRVLIAAVVEAARARKMQRVEVGLPRERFPGFAATESFYLGSGFEHLGPRMRRTLV